MAIPTQTDMFGIVLRLMNDGKTRSRKQIKALVSSSLNLSNMEQLEVTPSGVPVYKSRADWAVSYLHRAGLLNKISRGVYCISDAGSAVLESGLASGKLLNELQRLIAEHNPWRKGMNEDKLEGSAAKTTELGRDIENAGSSPQETIENAIDQLNNDLELELIDLIMNQEPKFFERLVVDLLERMGYGVGQTTRYVGDGGIDGIITKDVLGFDPIYTQAKRYAVDNLVGKPELQKFAGALGSATKGVFITTSDFTSGAIEYARHYPHATIALINGERLMELMRTFNVGVSTERVFELKRIDIDYFEND